MRVVLVVGLLGLAGCVTVADQEQARFASFNGLSMTEFMRLTLVTPRDQFETQGQRVFVAEQGGCAMQITTRANGKGRGPDGWTIATISRRGNCSNV